LFSITSRDRQWFRVVLAEPIRAIACRDGLRFDGAWHRVSGYPNRPQPEPSIINEKTVADFTRVVEQTGTNPPATA
jgi:hypothetical protein